MALVGASLIAAATALGGILVHDGERATTPLAAVAPGDAVLLKGSPQPFYPSGSLAAWEPVLPLLATHNHTYLLEEGNGPLALLMSDTPAPDAVVLTEGTVTFLMPFPDGPERMLVVIHVGSWRQPLLFR